MSEESDVLTEINSTLRQISVVPNIGVTIASLPSSPTVGQIGVVTDGDASLAWGATVVNTGAGATKYFVWWNGSAWAVMGK